MALYIANPLSRAWVQPPMTCDSKVQAADDEDLEGICLVNLDTATPQMDRIQKETSRDHTLQTVQSLIEKGWPDLKHLVPEAAKPYFSMRDELVMEGGVVFRGPRCVIPAILLGEVLKQLHVSHMGVESTLRGAREMVFWPRINAELRDYISKCDTC